MADPQLPNEDIAEKAREAVDRAIERNALGIEPIPDVAREFGPTPKDTIHSRGTLKLYHYRPVCEEVYRIPLVLIMSLVSKAYILDLTKGQSLIEFLVSKGFDVYLIDWGVPRREHSKLRLEDYVLDFMPECLEVIAEESGETDVNMVGYCMGGMLACMYAALHADGPLQNLATFTTPVNGDGMPLYKTWTDPAHFDLDRLIDELGNIPPELMMASMQMLRPFQKQAGQMKLLDNVDNDEFVKAHLRFDTWAADQIPFPGETARQFVRDFIRENKFVRNELEIGGRKVDFGDIRVPFLHVAAQHDHIVPSEASKDLIGLVGSEDKTEIILKGGHVSLVAGGNAVYRLWPKLEMWLGERSV